EVETGELKTAEIGTEVFFLPAAAHTEKDGTFTNTQRLLQWHHKAVEPPGDARSELWFYYHLGRLIRQKLSAAAAPAAAHSGTPPPETAGGAPEPDAAPPGHSDPEPGGASAPRPGGASSAEQGEAAAAESDAGHAAVHSGTPAPETDGGAPAFDADRERPIL